MALEEFQTLGFANGAPAVFAVAATVQAGDLLVVVATRAGGTSAPVVTGFATWTTLPNKSYNGEFEVTSETQVADIINSANAHVYTLTGAAGTGSVTVTANYTGTAALYIIRGLAVPAFSRSAWHRIDSPNNATLATVSAANVRGGSFVIAMANRYAFGATFTMSLPGSSPAPSTGWTTDSAPTSGFGTALAVAHLEPASTQSSVSATLDAGSTLLGQALVQLLVFGEPLETRLRGAYAEVIAKDTDPAPRRLSGAYAEVASKEASAPRAIHGAYLEAIEFSAQSPRELYGAYVEIIHTPYSTAPPPGGAGHIGWGIAL